MTDQEDRSCAHCSKRDYCAILKDATRRKKELESIIEKMEELAPECDGYTE